jgi:U4/U6.U5 tri-snRNP-associated protein 1
MDKVNEYTESACFYIPPLCSSYQERVEDLIGFKVSHDFDDEMGDGETRILTLKDSRVLDNEGARPIASCHQFAYTDLCRIEDELENVEMAEEERRRKNIALRTKKQEYTGYDDDEFVNGNVGMERSVLAKYDVDIDGIKESVSTSILQPVF